MLEKLREHYTKVDDEGKETKYFFEVDCSDGINHKELEKLIAHGFEQGWETAVVFDDCLAHAQDKKILNLFISGRHQKVSVFELQQQIFPKGTRGHRLNCSQFVVFKFPARNEFGTLASQICTDKEDRRELVNKFKDIVGRGKGHCIIIDMATRSTQKFPCKVRNTYLNLFVPEFWNI